MHGIRGEKKRCWLKVSWKSEGGRGATGELEAELSMRTKISRIRRKRRNALCKARKQRCSRYIADRLRKRLYEAENGFAEKNEL